MLLRRRLRSLLRRLRVEPSAGVAGIVAAVADAIDTPITVRPHPLVVPGCLAMVVDHDDVGIVIFVQSATTAEHQAHLALHELAHVILGTSEDLTEWQRGQVRRVGDYSIPTERDAEWVARVITTWLDLESTAALSSQPDPRAERLASAVQDRITW